MTMLQYKTYDNTETYEINENELYPWQKKLLNYVDISPIHDLLAYLFESEYPTEQDTLLSPEDIFNEYPYIWDGYLFIEQTGMNYEMIRWYRTISEKKPCLISDSDTLLLLTAKLCIWGGYDFYHKYALYKCIVNGKYKKLIQYFDENEWLKRYFYEKK